MHFSAVATNNAANSGTLIVFSVIALVVIAGFVVFLWRKSNTTRNAPVEDREARVGAEFQRRPSGHLPKKVGLDPRAFQLTPERVREIAAQNGYEYIGTEGVRSTDYLQFRPMQRP